MSITLKLTHEEGVRLRQQSANKIEHKEDKENPEKVTRTSTEWRFMKRIANDGKTVEECQQDEDPRRVDNNGRKLQLGTYTVHVTAGMNNLVIERKGKVTPFNFKNNAIRNQLRVQYQRLTDTGRKTKEQKTVYEWKNDGPAQYVPPNTFSGAFVGDSQRAIVDEMPT
jgi:hypothetical protein